MFLSVLIVKQAVEVLAMHSNIACQITGTLQ